VFIWNMLSLNSIKPFGINPILNPCGLGPKQTISYHLGQDVTYGIKAIAQPEMGERAQAHRGRQRGLWVLRGVNCDAPHCMGMDYMMCLYEIYSL
jgi:hypothetical protein